MSAATLASALAETVLDASGARLALSVLEGGPLTITRAIRLAEQLLDLLAQLIDLLDERTESSRREVRQELFEVPSRGAQTVNAPLPLLSTMGENPSSNRLLELTAGAKGKPKKATAAKRGKKTPEEQGGLPGVE